MVKHDDERVYDSHPEWGVLASLEVDLEVTVEGGGDVPEDYSFRLKVDPDATGIQIRDSGICNWGNTLPDEDKVSDWFSLPAPATPAVATIKAVRCGLGMSVNYGFHVYGTDPSGNEFLINSSGRMDKAWHRDSSEVTYWIDKHNLWATHSTLATGTPSGGAVDITGYEKATAAWNAVIDGPSATTDYFNEQSGESGAGVIIKIFETSALCGKAVACVTDAPNSSYPNMADGQPEQRQLLLPVEN